MRFIKMVDFQLKLYVKNSYFVNLVIISTTTMLMYQYLAHYVNHNYSGKEWLIAGVMGTWANQCRRARFSEMAGNFTIFIKYGNSS